MDIGTCYRESPGFRPIGGNSTMEYTIRECTMEDLPLLRNISYQTYDATFRDMNTLSVMIAYLDQAFDIRELPTT